MTAWTPDMDSILMAGWQAGLTEPQIALKMGGGFSRHSVASRRRRLKLPDRPPECRRDTLVLSNQTRRREFAPPPQPPKGTVQMSVFERGLPGTTPRPWLTREFGECAWPVSGQGADTFSCCAPVDDPKRPYCARHSRIRQAKS